MSRHNPLPIFLARGGQSFGPYTEDDIQGLRERGELLSYSWIWNGDGMGWKPLDPPPAGPPSLETATAPDVSESIEAHREPVHRAPVPAPAPSRPVAREPAIMANPHLEVVCHDFHHMVVGKLQRVGESGCELICESGEGPQFNRRSAVMLNILDPDTGRTMNAPARFLGASRVDGKWAYRLQWDSCPDLVAQ